MIIGQSDNLGWSLSVVNKNDAFMCTPNHESVSHLEKKTCFWTNFPFQFTVQVGEASL